MSEEETEDFEMNKLERDIDRLKKLKNKELRILVESFYDMQKLRIAMGSRIFAYGKAGLLEDINPEPSFAKLKEAEHELEKEIACLDLCKAGKGKIFKGKDIREKHGRYDRCINQGKLGFYRKCRV